MEKYTDFTKLRTDKDIKLAKLSLRHKVVLQERMIGDTFQNFGEYFVNSLKLTVVQIGTSILTATLIRLIRSNSK
ncbi:MAG: hypothetical protein RQ761_05235 [Bacteroidales bacterium]|nr:hypothetical protein [Bacteroidales bacterium]